MQAQPAAFASQVPQMYPGMMPGMMPGMPYGGPPQGYPQQPRGPPQGSPPAQHGMNASMGLRTDAPVFVPGAVMQTPAPAHPSAGP